MTTPTLVPIPADTPMARIEHALTKGYLYAEMANGKFWQCRRNGATKTWKTRPGEYRIPIKCGLKSCGQITHDNHSAFRFA